MVAQKTHHYVEITWVLHDINKASDSVNVQFVYPRRQHEPLVGLETRQPPPVAFYSGLRDERTWCQLSSTCPNSVVFVITGKILSDLFVWKLTSLMTLSAVIWYWSFWHYIGFQCKHFWMRENRQAVMLKINFAIIEGNQILFSL